MTTIDRDDLHLEVGDTGSVWHEVIAILPKDSEIPCDFCNHPGSTAERGTVTADYVYKIGHSGAAYCCNLCVDPAQYDQ